MNIGTRATRKRSSEALGPARFAGSQLSLPLEADSRDEDALRLAWTQSGLSLPYHVALRNRPLAICLSCLADAIRKKTDTDRDGADSKRESNRMSKTQHACSNHSKAGRLMQ